jgi:actin-related protein
MKQQTKYSTVVIDVGSGLVKAGFGGEDGPRSIFNSTVGTPKEVGLMVGMELKERYVGDDAISKYEIMNFSYPIQRGEVTDWDKFENLIHYLLYSEMKVVPEEVSILITESPRTSRENREKLTEILFETFNVKRLHIANSSMLGLFSYGKTSGLIVDSGFNITSTVPVYEGYPLSHASIRINIGGEDLSKNLLSMIQNNLDETYIDTKGRILADDIKEKLGYLLLNPDDGDDVKDVTYELPDGKKIALSKELYKANEILFSPNEENEKEKGLLSIKSMVIDSINKCDNEIKNDIKENICLTGGTTLLKNFPEKLKNELSESSEGANFNLSAEQERLFSTWIGGSIVSSLDNFQFMWVNKKEYTDNGKNLLVIDSKCF